MIFKNIISKNYSGDTLTGNTGYKGRYSGKCVVIKDFKKVSNFSKGSILVTGMTDPNYVPLMKKAGAIVTDAGGILCHAAIVSRELKIPCVIGTKVATQVFKTGDELEVDADNGVIKIVK